MFTICGPHFQLAGSPHEPGHPYENDRFFVIRKSHLLTGIVAGLAIGGITILGSYKAAAEGYKLREVQVARDRVFRYADEAEQKLASLGDDIVCRSLTIKNDEGAMMAKLYSDANGGRISIINKAENGDKAGFQITSDNDGWCYYHGQEKRK